MRYDHQVFDKIIDTKSITRFQDFLTIYLIEKVLYLTDSTDYLTITFLMTSLQQNFDFDKWRSVVCSIYFKGDDAGLGKDKVGTLMYNCMDWNSYLFAVNVIDEIIKLKLKFEMTLISIYVSENIYNILEFKTKTRWRYVSKWRSIWKEKKSDRKNVFLWSLLERHKNHCIFLKWENKFSMILFLIISSNFLWGLKPVGPLTYDLSNFGFLIRISSSFISCKKILADDPFYSTVL